MVFLFSRLLSKFQNAVRDVTIGVRNCMNGVRNVKIIGRHSTEVVHNSQNGLSNFQVEVNDFRNGLNANRKN